MKFSKLGKPETIEYRYLGKIDKAGLSFMKSLLNMEPGKRLTSSEALWHSYFAGLNNEILENDAKLAVNTINIINNSNAKNNEK